MRRRDGEADTEDGVRRRVQKKMMHAVKARIAKGNDGLRLHQTVAKERRRGEEERKLSAGKESEYPKILACPVIESLVLETKRERETLTMTALP